MISLICTNCQAELTMDDAFAGGVCRCQHCGTIQTVPSGKGQSSTSKALYQKAATPTGAGEASGLAGFGQNVPISGSGLAGSGLQSGRMTAPAPAKEASPAPTAPAEAPKRREFPLVPVLAVLAVLLIAGVGVGAFLWSRSHTPQVPAKGPTFAGATINANAVIYLLDNGNSTAAMFDSLKAACYRSIQTLGPDRSFQVMLWDNGRSTVTYPPEGLRPATSQEIAACKHALTDTVASGTSHLAGPLKAALAQKPAAIVIATGKYELDRDDLNALGSAGDAGVRLYTFGLGEAPEQGALKLAATATGGQYKHLSAGELSTAAE